MKSDRELDVLIAKYIMEWERYDDPTGEFTNEAFGWKSPRAAYGVCPHFSTDPVASDMLLDAMRERGFWYRVQGPFDMKSDLHFAGFTQHSCTGWNGRPDNQVGDKSKYRALALSALKAVGVEV